MESISTGATANLASDSTKGIFGEIIRLVKYVIYYNENVGKFDEKTQSLEAKRKSVQQEVNVAERNGGKTKPDVELWCNKVDKAMDEALKEVNVLQDKAKSKCCFIGLCSRYKLSRKAEDGCQAFDELLQQCHFNQVAYRDVPEAMADMPPKDFEAFDSRYMIFGQILEALKDGNKTNMIGVYGKGGVGKTTLVNEVGRQVLKSKLFDCSKVVKATVTQCPDVANIQDQIAEPLGLNLTEKSIVVRASRLLQRLKQETKVLVVLDDIWERLELEEVGIPFGDHQHKGCKILLTSRNQDVLTNAMDADNSFEIGVLEDYEAWELFKKKAGDIVESDHELRPIAVEVVQKCGGLPGVITRVARELRNKQVFVWKDALRNAKLFSM